MPSSPKFLLVAGALALIAAPAFAKTAKSAAASAPAPAPVAQDSTTSWAGAYAGLDVGGTWGNFNNGPSGVGGNASGGAFGGYNWQSGHYVYGGEADISGIDVRAKSATSELDEDWSMTFRGRAGYAVDNFLPYITAGLALTSTTWSLTSGGSSTTIRPGFAGGAGVDVALCPKWSVRGEYLYTAVPSENVNVGSTTLKGGSSDHTLRAGVGYHF